jgi:integration host factor subunit alpha
MVNNNFTRKDLSNKIYKNVGFSKNLSLKIVDDFFESIILDIIKSNKIKISSFGTFSILNKKERMGRNPKTGVEKKIFSRKVVKFKSSLPLKKKINQNEY